MAWLSATGEPLLPWAWVTPDTYRLLQVEVLTTDIGLTEGPLTMEHTGMAGCLEAFRCLAAVLHERDLASFQEKVSVISQN